MRRDVKRLLAVLLSSHTVAGVTMLLALSVYQTIVIEKLPVTSDAVPLLGKCRI